MTVIIHRPVTSTYVVHIHGTVMFTVVVLNSPI